MQTSSDGRGAQHKPVPKADREPTHTASAVLLTLLLVALLPAPARAGDGPEPSAMRARLLYARLLENPPEHRAWRATSGEFIVSSETLRGSWNPGLQERYEAASYERGRQDPWLGPDKVKHLAVSFLLTLGSQYTLVNKIDRSECGALPVSVGFSAAVGLSKEMYDWRRGSTHLFSYRDLAADAVGIALAAGLILL